MYSSHSSLNITLTEQHFTEDGKIEISCTASIGSLSSRARTGSKVGEGEAGSENSIFVLTNLKYFRGRALILNGLGKLCFRLLSRISVGSFKIKTKNFQEDYCSHFTFLSQVKQKTQQNVRNKSFPPVFYIL